MEGGRIQTTSKNTADCSISLEIYSIGDNKKEKHRLILSSSIKEELCIHWKIKRAKLREGKYSLQYH